MNDPHTTSPNTSPPTAGVPAAVREMWSEFYTDEEIAAMGDALVREDVVEAARRLRAYHARQRAAADQARPPAEHAPVAAAEPQRWAGPPPDQAEAAAEMAAEAETGWEMPVQQRGDAQPTRPALAEGTAESRDSTGRATQHGAVDEFEGVPEAGPTEVTVSVAQAARRLVAAGHDPDRARTLVADYVQDTSRHLGFPTAGWGLDQHDLDAIEASTDPPAVRRDWEVRAEEGELDLPNRDQPQRDPVDPLDRARSAVADLPHPTHDGHLGSGSDDDATAAIGWADYLVAGDRCAAAEDDLSDDDDLSDTGGDER